MIAAWLDGVPARGLPLQDRGLAYGDGLFETLRLVDGRPRLLARHLARLASGCRRLGFAAPSAEVLAGDVAQAAAAAPADGVVKLIVTRGDGERGYRPPPAPRPRRLALALAAPGHADGLATAGVVLRWCALRLAVQPALAGLKHLNRLEQVLARAEWHDPDVHEGLLVDGAGRVVGATQGNLFACIDGTLVTPALQRCGIDGVMRGWVLDTAAALGWATAVADLAPRQVEQAEALFVTNAVIGLWPVRRLGTRDWPASAHGRARELQRCLAAVPA